MKIYNKKALAALGLIPVLAILAINLSIPPKAADKADIARIGSITNEDYISSTDIEITEDETVVEEETVETEELKAVAIDVTKDVSKPETIDVKEDEQKSEVIEVKPKTVNSDTAKTSVNEISSFTNEITKTGLLFYFTPFETDNINYYNGVKVVKQKCEDGYNTDIYLEDGTSLILIYTTPGEIGGKYIAATIDGEPAISHSGNTFYTASGKIAYFGIGANGTYGETGSDYSYIKAAVDEIYKTEGINSNFSEYEKVKAVYSYITKNFQYDYNMSYVQKEKTMTLPEPFDVNYMLITKSGVCMHFAKIMEALCNDMGVECRYITGDAKGYHAWNVVYIDGGWYHCDSTWDLGKSNWDYFLLSTDSITQKGHTVNTEIPECLNNY